MTPQTSFSKTGGHTRAASLRRIGLKAGLGLVGFWLLLSCPLPASEAAPAHPDPAVVQFCISSSLFRGVNENDARASVKVYAKVIAESRGMLADPNPKVYTGIAELAGLLDRREADLVSLPTEEFMALAGSRLNGPILVASVNGSDYEEYVLLVRADSGVNAPADLKDRRMLVLDSVQGSLAGPWLEVLLNQQGLGPPETFFGRVTPAINTAQTVLPVFFGQSDACVVTRIGFALMGELNPQVTKQLRILATSPLLVPHMTCFRVGLEPALKAKIVAAITEANTTTAGLQVMTIFQCDRVDERSLSFLQSTQELLAARARLHGGAGSVGSAGTPSSSVRSGGAIP